MKTLSLAAAALTAAAMFGLTACGGGDGSQNTGPGTLSKAQQDQSQKFSACMRQHGIDVPDNPGGRPSAKPAGGGNAVVPLSGSSVKIEAARAACAKYAPSQEAGEDVTAADQDRALKKAECLRKQGINAKDPKPGTVEISVEEGPGDTPDKLVAAYTTCNKQVPNSQN
jgi:hypothetical protein